MSTKKIWMMSVLLLGCAPAEMHPGERCGACHSERAEPARRAVAFGAGGTVYADPSAHPFAGTAGVTVELVDAAGAVVALPTNDVGNFYTTQALRPPLRVALVKGSTRVAMKAPAPTGDCNGCHAPGGKDVAGRVWIQ